MSCSLLLDPHYVRDPIDSLSSASQKKILNNNASDFFSRIGYGFLTIKNVTDFDLSRDHYFLTEQKTVF